MRLMSATFPLPGLVTVPRPSLPGSGLTIDRLRRITVQQYDRMIEAGVLGESDPVELLDGYLVEKMSRNDPHDSRLSRITRMMRAALPAAWMDRGQMALALEESVPEPDLCIVRFDPDDYAARKPQVGDLGLVVEVSDSSRRIDTTVKNRTYAAGNVPEYWVVNIPDRQVEVFTQPSPEGYLSRQVFAEGTAVPVILDGQTVTGIDVTELFR